MADEPDRPQAIASEAEIDALEYVVHQGIIGAYDRPVLLAWLARLQRTPAEPSTPGEGTRQSEGTSHSDCPYVTGTVTRYCTLTPFTLTDEEREALANGASSLESEAMREGTSLGATAYMRQHAASLRSLLTRLG